MNVGEVGSAPRSSSPLIDVEAVSDDESDTPNSVVGQCVIIKIVNLFCCLSVLLHFVVYLTVLNIFTNHFLYIAYLLISLFIYIYIYI